MASRVDCVYRCRRPNFPTARVAPEGFLFITSDDYVSFNFKAVDRAAFASEDIFAGTRDELATAAKVIVSFAGPFRIEGETIVVDFEVSLFPNWIGKPQVRAFELAKNALTLRMVRSLSIAGALRRGEARLVWA